MIASAPTPADLQACEITALVPPTSTWGEARVGLLIRDWISGCSASKIGAAIGVPKNAVIGKIGRIEKILGKKIAREHIPSSRPGKKTEQAGGMATPRLKLPVRMPVWVRRGRGAAFSARWPMKVQAMCAIQEM